MTLIIDKSPNAAGYHHWRKQSADGRLIVAGAARSVEEAKREASIHPIGAGDAPPRVVPVMGAWER